MKHGASRTLAGFFLLVFALGPALPAPAAKRAYVVAWDGAADWVVDRLLQEGRLPNVARLARTGVRASCMPAFPSMTACGFAALWTGAYSDVNGVTGNEVPRLPRAEHTVLEYHSGFLAPALLAEPLWMPAARAGKRVVALAAPQADPPYPWVAALRDSDVPAGRFIALNGYELPIQEDKVWDGADLRPATGWEPLPPHQGSPKELSFSVGDTPFHALIYDDPNDPRRGADTLLLRQESKKASRAPAWAELKPAGPADHVQHFSPRFRVRKGDLFGYTCFRLFALTPDGGMRLYQRAAHALRGSSSPAELQRYLEAAGGFHSKPFRIYRDGAFGPPLWQDGDGTAEQCLLECMRLDVEILKRATRYVLKEWQPDLLLHYAPAIDGAGHIWMGALDPESPRHDASLAQKLWPYYATLYHLHDGWLGEILDASDKDTVTCLVSDHGFQGVGRYFSPNAVLEKAGLLERTPGGEIDLRRTRICAPWWSEQSLSVNGTDWKGGVVAPREREAVLSAATEALLAAVDPETGRRVVTRIFRPESTAGLGIGGPAGGDLYFDLAAGYTVTPRLTTGIVEPVRWPVGGGSHGAAPLNARMQGICFFAGAGIAPARRLAGMRQIDVAPTLSHLLGIPPPKDARGHVLGEILAEKR